MSISEKQIENQILDYLNLKGIFAFKVQTTGIYDPSKGAFRRMNKRHIRGISDILCCVDGLMMAIEVKKPYISKKTNQIKHRTQEELEKLASDEQKDFINKIKRLGGIGFYSDSIETLEEQLLLFGIIK